VVAYPGVTTWVPASPLKGLSERCRSRGRSGSFFCGQRDPTEGLHTLVLALSRLSHESWQLTVAGSLSADVPLCPSDRATHLWDRTGGAGENCWTRSQPEQLVGLLESHHCLAVPSFNEGFGIVYLESDGVRDAGSSRLRQEPFRRSLTTVVRGFWSPPAMSTTLMEAIGRLIRKRNLLPGDELGRQGSDPWVHPTWAESAARGRGIS